MCKKHTSVSHSSTESDVVSLDVGLRMDGIPALERWDLIAFFQKTFQFGETRGETNPKENTPTPRRRNTSTDMMLNYYVLLQQTQNHVEEPDAGRKTLRRGTCGWEIKTNDEFSVVRQSPTALGSIAS